MSAKRKSIMNGSGTNLTIHESDIAKQSAYISIGKDGTDIMIRGCGKVFGFNDWESFISAIDNTKAAYYKIDY